MAPGEAETEVTETISESRASPEEEDTTDEPDTNHLEPQPVLLGKAKQSALNLAQFVGDNMGIFTECEYRAMLQLLQKVQGVTKEQCS